MKYLFDLKNNPATISLVIDRVEEIYEQLVPYLTDSPVLNPKIKNLFYTLRGYIIKKQVDQQCYDVVYSQQEIDYHITERMSYDHHPEQFSIKRRNTIVLPRCDTSTSTTNINSYNALAAANYMNVFAVYHYAMSFAKTLKYQLINSIPGIENDIELKYLNSMYYFLYNRLFTIYSHMLAFANLSKNKALINTATLLVTKSIIFNPEKSDQDLTKHISFNGGSNIGYEMMNHNHKFETEISSTYESIVDSLGLTGE